MSQYCLRALRAFLIRVRMKRSRIPFIYVWQGELRRRWKPTILDRWWKRLLSNWRPWSVIRKKGTPNRLTQDAKKTQKGASYRYCCYVRDKATLKPAHGAVDEGDNITVWRVVMRIESWRRRKRTNDVCMNSLEPVDIWISRMNGVRMKLTIDLGLLTTSDQWKRVVISQRDSWMG